MLFVFLDIYFLNWSYHHINKKIYFVDLSKDLQFAGIKIS